MTFRRFLPTILAAASLATTCRAQDATPPSPGSAAGPPPSGGQSRPHGEFFQSLGPDQQERFLKLLDDWAKLTPDQRRAILDRFGQSRNLSAEQRAQLQRRLRWFEQMPSEQRERIRERMHKWQQMAPEERQQAIEREREARRKAETDLSQRLNELDAHPTAEQMRWIHQYYFQKRRQIDQQVVRQARELRTGLPSDATEEQKQQVRQQVQQYRYDLEQRAREEFAEFVRNPHSSAPRESRSESEHGKENSSSRSAPRAPAAGPP